MATELSQYKTYEQKEEYFGHFASTQRLYDVMCTVPLVTPNIRAKCDIYDTEDTLVKTQTIANPTSPTYPFSTLIVETGYKVKVNITRWWFHNDANADPDSATFPIGNNKNVLPTSGEILSSPEQSIIESTTYTFKLYRTKTAPSVSNNVLIKPTGTEKLETSVSCSISFRHQQYIGKTTNPNSIGNSTSSSELNTLLGKASSSSVKPALTTARTLDIKDVLLNDGEYLCYLYPSSLSELTKIIQDGASPALSLFNKKTITVTNDAGADISYYLYVSANSGAFKNCQLTFS